MYKCISKNILSAFLLILNCGCSTVLETLDHSPSPLDYSKSKKSSGETVYVRKRTREQREAAKYKASLTDSDLSSASIFDLDFHAREHDEGKISNSLREKEDAMDKSSRETYDGKFRRDRWTELDPSSMAENELKEMDSKKSYRRTRTSGLPDNVTSLKPVRQGVFIENSPSALGIDLSFNSNHAHIGIMYNSAVDDPLNLRLGASFFTDRNLYAGFDGAVRFQFHIFQVRNFVGLGGYLGDNKRCEIDENDLETCEKKFLSAGYTEFGLGFESFNLFWRNYSINVAGLSLPARNFLGLGFVF